MQTEALKKLVYDIQSKKTETQTIELKSAEYGCPTRLFDTLSSFSNQDEGGIIVFGMDEKDGYKIKEHELPDDEFKFIAETISEFVEKEQTINL